VNFQIDIGLYQIEMGPAPFGGNLSVDVLAGLQAVGTTFSNILNSGGESLAVAALKVKENFRKPKKGAIVLGASRCIERHCC